MLACNCSDTPDGIEILCAILPMNGVPSGQSPPNYLMQVLFPDELAARLIGTCASADISVHSNRFPATRFETQSVGLGAGQTRTSLPSPDCASRGTCREMDATVYVIPR